MFRRRKTRVAPQLVDSYIQRRYEDMAVCIARDISSNRGLFCHYSPWLDLMMSKFELTVEYRAKHSLVVRDSQGQHIGCSGAVKNSLVYYNPHERGESQHKEAVWKSYLSAKFGRASDKSQSNEQSPGRQVQFSETQRPTLESPCGVESDSMTAGSFATSSGIQEHQWKRVKNELKSAEDALFDSDPQPVNSIAEGHHEECLPPQCIGEDGVAHAIRKLGPVESKVVDEAFCEPKLAGNTNEGSHGNPKIEISHAIVGGDAHNSKGLSKSTDMSNAGPGGSETAKSRFCMIL
jgi:hypothetical protein